MTRSGWRMRRGQPRLPRYFAMSLPTLTSEFSNFPKSSKARKPLWPRLHRFGLVWLICSLLVLLDFRQVPIVTTVDAIKFEEFEALQERTKKVFYHAYDSYLEHAFPKDELQPISCGGRDTWGAFSLSLVDALDTLLVLGNKTEFARVAKYLATTMHFDYDMNVSVFESNIRIVGGLISGHLLAGTQVPRYMLTPDILPPGWPCEGRLLELAVELADKLMPAFDTNTGMPYGTVNLANGVPHGETTITCTAGVGTFLVEFGSLSDLTGDPKYMEAANKAMDALWKYKSKVTGLLGNHLRVDTGLWTAAEAGVGGAIDSYFEYLVKGAILFNNGTWMDQWVAYKSNIDKFIRTKEGMYYWANMNSGSTVEVQMDSLSAFLPGVQTLYGDIPEAMETVKKLAAVALKHGGYPEKFSLSSQVPVQSRSGYPLRPELIESIFYLYRSTRHPQLIELGSALLHSIENLSRTECGYATIRSVLDHSLEDRMESFFLAETLKYFYLLFDPDNFLHDHDDQTFHQTGQIFHNGECVLNAGGYVFNTEAHPVDPGALACCRAYHGERQSPFPDQSGHDAVLDDFDLRGRQSFYSSSDYITYNNTWWNIIKEPLPKF